MGKKIKITPKILEEIKKIPPCSIGLESSEGILADTIKWYHIIKMVIMAIIQRKINIFQIVKFVKALTAPYKTNHAYIYWGSGKNETVDAVLKGVRKGNFIEKIEDGAILKVYSNKNITVNNMQIAKAYSYGTVGRLYGYTDFAAYGTDLIDRVLKTKMNLKPTPFGDTCTENAVMTIDIALTGKLEKPSKMIVPGVKRPEIHPQVLTEYLAGAQAKKDGWTLVFNNAK